MTATARSQESDEMTEKRRKSVALRTASRRSEEPSESRDNRNRSNANRTASRRSEEPDDVKQQRIRDNTIRTAATRASESVTLTLARRSADRSRKASRPSAFLGIAASGVHPDVHYFGRMNKRCAHCGALYFEEEATTKGEYTACCITGAVKLEIKKNFPSALMKLFMRTDSESKNFKQNIRQYNNSLAMACLMASIDVPQGKGPYSLKLHKQVYHLIGDLHPVQGVKESFAQIFIIDTEQAAAELAGRELNNNCSEAFFQKFF